MQTTDFGDRDDLVAVVEEIGWCGVVREGVHDLLGGPVGGGMLGHVKMDDLSAMMNEHDQNEEDAQAYGGNREEVEGDEISDMVVEERPPGLGWRSAPLRHQPGHGSLGHVDAELEELGMDTWRTPERIRRGHSPDQGFDLGIDRRAAAGGPGGERGPVLAEATPLPPQDGVGSDDHERPPPVGPHSGQRDPEKPISSAQWGPAHRSLVDGELLPQGHVLEGELAVAAEEDG